MDEICSLVLTTCTILLAAELLLHLFPEQSGKLVHGFAVLTVLTALLSGVLHSDLDLNLPVSGESFTIQEEQAEELYASTGIALLRERLYQLLDAADIAVSGDEEGVEIWYTQDDEGVLEIDRVRVRLQYVTDTDRAFAVLRSVLTEAIPVEVFAE